MMMLTSTNWAPEGDLWVTTSTGKVLKIIMKLIYDLHHAEILSKAKH
jgi:hypothetical protein